MNLIDLLVLLISCIPFWMWYQLKTNQRTDILLGWSYKKVKPEDIREYTNAIGN